MVYRNDTTTQRRNWERTYNITLDIATKRNLRAYMQQELTYYNTLVVEFNSKLRVLYNEIDNLKDHYECIWLNVAQTGIDLRAIAKEPINNWPEALQPYADYIVKNNKFLLSDRMMILFDIAATKVTLHPLIRRAIAVEILRWVQPQARQIADANLNASGQMRNPIQMLQPMEYATKRHIQLITGIAEILYDHTHKSSIIKIPYSTQPITIEGHDLTKMPHDHIIIRQKPGKLPDDDTPWQVTVREGNGRYLLDVTDMSYTPIRKKNKK